MQARRASKTELAENCESHVGDLDAGALRIARIGHVNAQMVFGVREIGLDALRIRTDAATLRPPSSALSLTLMQHWSARPAWTDGTHQSLVTPTVRLVLKILLWDSRSSR